MGELLYRTDGQRAKPVGTLADVAQATAKTKDATRKALTRAGVTPIDPPPVDERTPLYWLASAVAAVRDRPGSGRRARPGKGRRKENRT